MEKRICITGDTHGDLFLLRIKKAVRLKYDYIIICGDFGYLWDSSKEELSALEEMSKLPITILWVDGNHENYDMLNMYSKTLWNGGFVQKIKPNILHLMRGEVYTIENKTFFTFGGAKSVDIGYRTEGIDWWSDELPNKDEKEYGIRRLAQYNNKVDYIITHTCASDTLKEILPYGDTDGLNDYLMKIKQNVKFNAWYFGHLHKDFNVNDKEFCLYNNIKEIN